MNQLRIEHSAKAVIRNTDGDVLLIRYQDGTDMGLGTTRAADSDQAAAERVPLAILGDLNVFPRRLRDLPALLDKPDMPVYWGDEY